MPDRPTPHGRGAHVEPPNRFTQIWREIDLDALDEEDRHALAHPPTRYILERSGSIVSENDSPDIPFRYSINPYRGCLHGCSYCMSGDTPILMADGTTRPLADLRVGHEIYGTVLEGKYRRFTKTNVLAHWHTIKPAYRVRLADGTELIASGDHRFLTQRGWKHVAPAVRGQRPFLTVNNRLLGIGHFAPPQILRKRTLDGVALKSDADTRILSIEPLNLAIPMYDITTRTGDFIANGIVSHNCYARPTHEYLGFNAGLDFETKIVVKENAPDLFRDFLNRPSWQPESITMSGITDCYQPAEQRFGLTRGCLEVAVEASQPMSIITKNALVVRDLDLLAELAGRRLLHVTVSVTTLDAELARKMEPRTSTPAGRLRAIAELAGAGVPVRVMVAPVIPGLTDSEVPAILEAAKQAGAHAAAFQLLRLPLTVAPVFLDWVQRERPDSLEKIEGRVRSMRHGKLNESAFHERFRGTGVIAEQIRALFRLFARRHGLDGQLPAYDCTQFRPPRSAKGQRWLF